MPTYNLEEDSPSWEFNQSRVKVQIMGGGFGNGKTAGLCIKAIQVATEYPGANILLGRATYSKLNDTLRKEFYKWIPKSTVRRWPSKDDNTMYLHNGTTINFRYVGQRGKTSEDGQTTSNLLSATYDFVGIDQIEDPEITEKDWRDLFGRLRGQTPYRGSDTTMPRTGPRWFVVTCNPTSNWFYRKVVKPIQLYQQRGVITDGLLLSKRSGKLLVDLIEGSTYTNRSNLPEDFIEGLEASHHGQAYERFVLGKWGAYEGLVYPQFSDEAHMLPEEVILRYMDRLAERRVVLTAIEAYDYGMAVPSCYGFGFVDDWGRIFVLDGFYKKEFPIRDTDDGKVGQASSIRNIRAKWSSRVEIKNAVRADPDMFRRKTMPGHKSVGTTIASEFSDLGIKMTPGDNSINSGIMKVSSYLNAYRHLPPIIAGEKSRLIYFSDNLEWFRDEFGNYFWKRNPQGEQEDQPQDRNDHAMDMLKYMLSFQPKASEIIIPKSEITPGYLRGWLEEPDEHMIVEF